MTEESCIWCGETRISSLEHIVPEALGCPPGFVLKKGVCAPCNNRNGKLDRALLTPFEIMTVLKGLVRKRGKRPTVDGFRSLSSAYNNDGPVFFINREKHPIELPNGAKLAGVNGTDPLKEFEFSRNADGTATLKYNQELRFDRQTVRGLFKIAVEAIAHFEGLEAARDPSLTAVKQFVMAGKGNFRAILTPDENTKYESYFGPCHISQNGSRVYGMTLLGIGFLCDFDPEFGGGAALLDEARNQKVQAQVVPNWPREIWLRNNPSSIERTR